MALNGVISYRVIEVGIIWHYAALYMVLYGTIRRGVERSRCGFTHRRVDE